MSCQAKPLSAECMTRNDTLAQPPATPPPHRSLRPSSAPELTEQAVQRHATLNANYAVLVVRHEPVGVGRQLVFGLLGAYSASRRKAPKSSPKLTGVVTGLLPDPGYQRCFRLRRRVLREQCAGIDTEIPGIVLASECRRRPSLLSISAKAKVDFTNGERGPDRTGPLPAPGRRQSCSPPKRAPSDGSRFGRATLCHLHLAGSAPQVASRLHNYAVYVAQRGCRPWLRRKSTKCTFSASRFITPLESVILPMMGCGTELPCRCGHQLLRRSRRLRTAPRTGTAPAEFLPCRAALPADARIDDDPDRRPWRAPPCFTGHWRSS